MCSAVGAFALEVPAEDLVKVVHSVSLRRGQGCCQRRLEELRVLQRRVQYVRADLRLRLHNRMLADKLPSQELLALQPLNMHTFLPNPPCVCNGLRMARL